MVGILSFLWLLSVIALAGSVVLAIVRAVKKRPVKPFLISGGVSAVAIVVLMAAVASVYVPPEKPAEEITAADPEPSEPAASPEVNEPEAAVAVPSVAEVEPAAADPVVPDVEPVQEAAAPTEKPTPTVAPAPSAAEKEKAAPSGSSSSKPAASPSVKPSDSTSEKKEASPSVVSPSPAEDVDEEPDFIEAHRTDIVVCADMTLERFVSNYKIPLASQLWTVAKFDGDGAVAAMVDVTEKSSKKTATAIVVFTPVMEGEKMTGGTPHFVSVGDTVYGDDGYCDDVFSVLAGLSGGTE